MYLFFYYYNCFIKKSARFDNNGVYIVHNRAQLVIIVKYSFVVGFVFQSRSNYI